MDVGSIPTLTTMEETDNLRDWLPQLIAEIKVENGLVPDAPGMTCLRCRKMVNCEDGYLFCECIDERKGIDPNDPSVIPITITDDGKVELG